MNVQCSTCATLFRVDPAKVPARGVRARCSVCAGVFFVPPPAAEPVPVRAAPTAPGAGAPALAAPAIPLEPGRPGGPPPAAGLAPPASFPAASTPVAAVPSRPPAPPVARAVPPSAAPAPGRKAVNPFLAQDPATKARRLARALISDLVVYHPARRADGLRDGTLKLLFEEEIRKCWEEYTEQVGMEMATGTTYFTDALNEILADGQRVFT
jgi:predicted Zn finger-like uncharacterized protein